MPITFLGKHHTDETKLKMRQAMLGKNIGKKRTPETIKKIRESHKGIKQSPEWVKKRIESRREHGYAINTYNTRKKISESLRNKYASGYRNKNCGRHHSIESKDKMRAAVTPINKAKAASSVIESNKRRVGDKSATWKGGVSFAPYGVVFNKQLRKEIIERDEVCQICGYVNMNGRVLSVHHVDYDKTNNCKQNLVALCLKCHVKTNFRREYWQGLLENILCQRGIMI